MMSTADKNLARYLTSRHVLVKFMVPFGQKQLSSAIRKTLGFVIPSPACLPMITTDTRSYHNTDSAVKGIVPLRTWAGSYEAQTLGSSAIISAREFLRTGKGPYRCETARSGASPLRVREGRQPTDEGRASPYTIDAATMQLCRADHPCLGLATASSAL